MSAHRIWGWSRSQGFGCKIKAFQRPAGSDSCRQRNIHEVLLIIENRHGNQSCLWVAATLALRNVPDRYSSLSSSEFLEFKSKDLGKLDQSRREKTRVHTLPPVNNQDRFVFPGAVRTQGPSSAAVPSDRTALTPSAATETSASKVGLRGTVRPGAEFVVCSSGKESSVSTF